MKIALIADIHANLPALDSVLEHAHAKNTDEIWFLGDAIGHGPFPEQVVKRLQKENSIAIMGNYDQKVLHFKENQKKWQSKKDPVKYFSFAWTHQHISPGTRKYLQGLPEQKMLERKGRSFLLVHGSPVNNEEALGPDTGEKHLKQLTQKAQADIVLCGHSHQPFIRKIGKTWFINPGSVGRPFDGDTRAAYAIISIKKNKIKVRHYRVDYDVDSVLRVMEQEQFPREFLQSLISGISINDLWEVEQKEQRTEKIEEAQELSDRLSPEKGHVRQVTKLALLLFDRLNGFHGLGVRERIWLEAAALVHDIGVKQDPELHHKAARDIIIKKWPSPVWNIREKMIVGLIARYHREVLPKKSHQYYRELDKKDQKVVGKLAALLRVADGLDRSHRNVVSNIVCQVGKNGVVMELTMRGAGLQERLFGKKKADLFEKIFEKKVELQQEKCGENFTTKHTKYTKGRKR